MRKAHDEIAWHAGNSDGETHVVGRKQPNAWGLFDTLGNVREWTADWFAEYSAAQQHDPKGPAHGEQKVLRGGSWFNQPRVVRVSRVEGV